jgi:hypothetical protein
LYADQKYEKFRKSIFYRLLISRGNQRVERKRKENAA